MELYRRFTSLGRSDRRLVLETAVVMALFWSGLRLLRFRTLLRIRDLYPPPAAHGQSAATARTIDRVHWAITAIAARAPSATCLVQALAADALLRRRGIASQLRLGVRSGGPSSAPIEAHAWIECEGAVAIGDIENLSAYQPLTVPEPR
jgi:Transglutaminase-like superfamily